MRRKHISSTRRVGQINPRFRSAIVDLGAVAPTIKHLFKGYDVTLFAYGVTGTGKTHTMKGGKKLEERGVIPRLLSSVFRRGRKIEKDTEGNTRVEVAMSYYEIYNDRVYDLFGDRTPLPLRESANGKTVVAGLSEQPCTTLKEFETQYEQANLGRSTSATKLNAHSSRSHAILCVKVTQTTGGETRISTASAIDLAGSEDNRRTENNKDRLVESASINKSLFVLAQCVEAISKKQARIPYRESKMTRILSLGQNEGITIMILNLAPVRSYHLDTLSSLNFANRTKKIEVNEVENQPFFRGTSSTKGKLDAINTKSFNAPSLHRQPLKPKILSQSGHLQDVTTNTSKPQKQFAVYSDKTKPAIKHPHNTIETHARPSLMLRKSPKRTSSEAFPTLGRPSKFLKPSAPIRSSEPALSQSAIEAMIDRKVSEILAERADSTSISNPEPVSDEVQRRLDALEKRIDGQATERTEGLQYLLMAKRHQVRGEERSALNMYRLAMPFFAENKKLKRKVAALQARIEAKNEEEKMSLLSKSVPAISPAVSEQVPLKRKIHVKEAGDESYHEQHAQHDSDDDFTYTKARQRQTPKHTVPSPTPPPGQETPRTKQLLAIINTKDVGQIKLLKGVGMKKAEAIVKCLYDVICDDVEDVQLGIVTSLRQLGKLKGVGPKTVENMRLGIEAA